MAFLSPYLHSVRSRRESISIRLQHQTLRSHQQIVQSSLITLLLNTLSWLCQWISHCSLISLPITVMRPEETCISAYRGLITLERHMKGFQPASEEPWFMQADWKEIQGHSAQLTGWQQLIFGSVATLPNSPISGFTFENTRHIKSWFHPLTTLIK